MNLRDKVFLIDLDGTMYRGGQPIEGAKEFIERLIQENIPFLFVTNNAMRKHQAAADNLNKITGLNVEGSHFYTSVDTLRFILSEDLESGKLVKQTGNAYVIGMDYLKDQVIEAGFNLVENVDQNPCDIVVVGLDQEVDYHQFIEASIAVQRGAAFYLTNPDVQFPSERGFVPGAGAIGQVITAATRIAPTVCGKPNALIIEGALAKMGFSKDRAVFLGDNLMTDISAAENAGIDAIFIETGVHTRDNLAEFGVTPTLVVENYEALLSIW
ncbi:TIGR01457 family HAD-type hydrolase [Aerococcus viridans]|uniref:HAD-IIA family hydrolase n=1 Tax=Aerococcus TaxID=1375 RepID=UPI0025BD8E36|nr:MULTISPECIES: HAD-IIA family hydrolase [unclassified Aerococcus]GMR69907.1 TIGR01457 family HAD-type hydrolase [Aerococcus viridans]